MNASTEQVLKVWMKLEDAYNGVARYGSDTAEIYYYLLMPYSPTYLATDGDHNATLCGKDNARFDARVLCDFNDIFGMFMEERECELEIEGHPIGNWVPEPFHRIHVKVIKKKG